MKTNVVDELKKIAAECGGILQPETVVAKARPKSSPLHSRFEWDDSVAGHQYRIWQARKLISVSVEMIQGSDDPSDVFVSLTTDRENDRGGYRIMTQVLSDDEMRTQMLADALAELECFREKYRRLKELAGVFDSIERVSRNRRGRKGTARPGIASRV
jgi:hypothetical protein